MAGAIWSDPVVVHRPGRGGHVVLVEESLGVDLARMRDHRRARLRAAMDEQGVDVVVLLGPWNVTYAGVQQPAADAMRMHHEAAVVVVSGDEVVVGTGFPEGVTDPTDLVVAPPALEHGRGVESFAADLRTRFPDARRIAFDELTSPMVGHLDALLPGVDLADAAPVLAAARLRKSADEVACIRTAQRITEAAMYDAQAALRPGVRQSELSAIFLRRVLELGATASIIDPVWSITPVSLAAGTTTVAGEVGFPIPSDDRFLREGDVLLTDAGIAWNGYHSDFGKTWICSLDPRPTVEQREGHRHWQEVLHAVLDTVRPGRSCGDLVRAARKVEAKHSLDHFYLGHGIGCSSVEAPMIGTHLGIAHDDGIELVPGMTFVLEPVIWRDGVGAYRSEEVVVVTDDGCEVLSSYGYTPFD